MNEIINYSVIVPHFNDFEGLSRLLPSIPDRDDIQILIIDDNSDINESIETEIDKYKKRNVELYINDINKKGAGACRNIGLSHAKGKWLLFADADDYFTDSAFDVFDEHLSDKEDIIYFLMTSVNLSDMSLGTRHIPMMCKVENFVKKHSKEAEQQLRYEYHSPCAKMVKNSLVKKYGIKFEEVICGNDVLFSVKVGRHAEAISAYMQPVYCATRSGGTLTTKKSDELFIARVEVHIRKIKYLREFMGERSIYKYVIWPGTDLIRAVINKYGKQTLKYIVRRYREERIPIYYFSYTRIVDCIKRKSRIFMFRHTKGR